MSLSPFKVKNLNSSNGSSKEVLFPNVKIGTVSQHELLDSSSNSLGGDFCSTDSHGLLDVENCRRHSPVRPDGTSWLESMWSDILPPPNQTILNQLPLPLLQPNMSIPSNSTSRSLPFSQNEQKRVVTFSGVPASLIAAPLKSKKPPKEFIFIKKSHSQPPNQKSDSKKALRESRELIPLPSVLSTSRSIAKSTPISKSTKISVKVSSSSRSFATKKGTRKLDTGVQVSTKKPRHIDEVLSRIDARQAKRAKAFVNKSIESKVGKGSKLRSSSKSIESFLPPTLRLKEFGSTIPFSTVVAGTSTATITSPSSTTSKLTARRKSLPYNLTNVKPVPKRIKPTFCGDLKGSQFNSRCLSNPLSGMSRYSTSSHPSVSTFSTPWMSGGGGVGGGSSSIQAWDASWSEPLMDSSWIGTSQLGLQSTPFFPSSSYSKESVSTSSHLSGISYFGESNENESSHPQNLNGNPSISVRIPSSPFQTPNLYFQSDSNQKLLLQEAREFFSSPTRPTPLSSGIPPPSFNPLNSHEFKHSLPDFKGSSFDWLDLPSSPTHDTTSDSFSAISKSEFSMEDFMTLDPSSPPTSHTTNEVDLSSNCLFTTASLPPPQPLPDFKSGYSSTFLPFPSIPLSHSPHLEIKKNPPSPQLRNSLDELKLLAQSLINSINARGDSQDAEFIVPRKESESLVQALFKVMGGAKERAIPRLQEQGSPSTIVESTFYPLSETSSSPSLPSIISPNSLPSSLTESLLSSLPTSSLPPRRPPSLSSSNLDALQLTNEQQVTLLGLIHGLQSGYPSAASKPSLSGPLLSTSPLPNRSPFFNSSFVSPSLRNPFHSSCPNRQAPSPPPPPYSPTNPSNVPSKGYLPKSPLVHNHYHSSHSKTPPKGKFFQSKRAFPKDSPSPESAFTSTRSHLPIHPSPLRNRSHRLRRDSELSSLYSLFSSSPPSSRNSSSFPTQGSFSPSSSYPFSSPIQKGSSSPRRVSFPAKRSSPPSTRVNSPVKNSLGLTGLHSGSPIHTWRNESS